MLDVSSSGLSSLGLGDADIPPEASDLDNESAEPRSDSDSDREMLAMPPEHVLLSDSDHRGHASAGENVQSSEHESASLFEDSDEQDQPSEDSAGEEQHPHRNEAPTSEDEAIIFQNDVHPERKTVQEIADFFYAWLSGTRAQSGMSKATEENIMNFIKGNAADLARAVQAGQIKSYKTYSRRHAYKHVPKYTLHVTYEDDIGSIHTLDNCKRIPKRLCNDPDKLLRVCLRHKLEDVYHALWKIFRPADPYPRTGVKGVLFDMSSDGVVKDNCGGRKLHIISVVFPDLTNVPVFLHIWEFLFQRGPKLMDLYQPFVDDLVASGAQLGNIILDGKESNDSRGFDPTNSFWACTRCICEGSTEKVIFKGREISSRNVYYPVKQLQEAPERTKEYWDDVKVNPERYAACNHKKMQSLRKGLKQWTPLQDIPEFDIVEQCPPDSMHIVHEGCTKRMIERTLSGRRNEKAFPKRNREQHLKAIGKVYHKTRLPFEMKRKPRKQFKPTQLKAQEWQSLGTVMLASIGKEVNARDLKTCLYLYSFLVRCFDVPDIVFAQIEAKVNLDRLMLKFLQLYVKTFGPHALTYNLHQLLHLLKHRRRHGPAWQYATSKYESAYSWMRTCFRPNTPNVPAQIARGYWGRLVMTPHVRNQTTLRFRKTETKKTDDTLVFTRGSFYKIVDITEVEGRGSNLHLQLIETKNFDSKTCYYKKQLPWGLVGVREYVGVKEDSPIRVVHSSEIREKAVISGQLISTMNPRCLIT